MSSIAGSDSTKNGNYFLYNDNLQLVFSGRYKSGLRHGTFKEFDSNGLLVEKSFYRRGILRWKQLYRNGKVYAVVDRKGNIKLKKNCGC